VITDKEKKEIILLNEAIPFERILLIYQKEKKEISIKEALELAKENSLDLFCVSPTATPPVCKILDYKKYLFDLNKEKKTKKDSSHKSLRISCKIESNDLDIKLNKVVKWIIGGSGVKIEIFMAGKEKIYPWIALEKCEKIVGLLKDKSNKIEIREGIKKHANTFFFLANKKK